MNEPKRRGRPPKAKVEGADSCEDCGQATGHYDDCPAGMTAPDPDAAQALALRIWNGQSPDCLARSERVARITDALAAQGFSMDGVVLPGAPDPAPPKEEMKPLPVDTRGIV